MASVARAVTKRIAVLTVSSASSNPDIRANTTDNSSASGNPSTIEYNPNSPPIAQLPRSHAHHGRQTGERNVADPNSRMPAARIRKHRR
jgi:hypothetical protein